MASIVKKIWIEAGIDGESILPEGYVFGENAFATIDSARQAVNDSTGAYKDVDSVEFLIASDFAPDAAWEQSAVFEKSVTFTALNLGTEEDPNYAEYKVESATGEPWVTFNGDLSVAENTKLDFSPSKSTSDGFLMFQYGNQTLNIDGEVVFGGGDFGVGDDSNKQVTINISETGKFLSYSTDNTSFCNCILNVQGTKQAFGATEAETLTVDDMQLRMGAYATLTGEVNINNAWVNLGTIGKTYWNATGVMTVKDSVIQNLATFSEDGNYVGVESSKEVIFEDSKVVIGSLDVTGNSITATNGEFTVAGKYVYDGGVIVADGQINLAAGTALNLTNVDFSAGAITNAGTINMDLATIENAGYSVASYTGAGTLNIDATGTDGSSFTIAAATALTSFENINVTVDGETAKDFIVAKVNDALTAVDTRVVTVNAAWTDETAFNNDTTKAAGLVWGVTAFGTLDTAVEAQKGGNRTYTFTTNVDTLMTIDVATTVASVNMNTYNVTTKGDKLVDSLGVTSDATTKVEFLAGKSYSIVFEGEDSVYTVATTSVKAAANTVKDVGTLTGTAASDTGRVGYKTGTQDFTFAVAEGQSAECTFVLSPTSGTTMDRVNYSIRTVDGKTIFTGSTDGTATNKLQLTAGNYVVSVDSFDGGEGDYTSNFTVTMTSTINTDVSATDNTIAGTTKAATKDDGVEGFVGLGDKTDYIALNLGTTDGEYSVKLHTAEGKEAAGLIIDIIEYTAAAGSTPAKEEILKRGVYTGVADLTVSGLFLDSAKAYYAKVTSPSKETSLRNAVYTVSLANTQDLTDKISSADDLWTGTGAAVDTFTNWVGDVDSVDWCKLSATTNAVADENGGVANVVTLYPVDDTKDDMVIGTLYRVQTGTTKLEDMGVILYGKVSSGTKVATAEIKCTTDYDYYMKFTTLEGNNANYTATIAAK